MKYIEVLKLTFILKRSNCYLSANGSAGESLLEDEQHFSGFNNTTYVDSLCITKISWSKAENSVSQVKVYSCTQSLLFLPPKRNPNLLEKAKNVV